jgi:hypothetical protein
MTFAILNRNAIADHFAEIREDRQASMAAKIAKQRYEDGCVFLMSLATGEPAKSIPPRVPIWDIETAATLSPNTVVCTTTGLTAKTKLKQIEYQISYSAPGGQTYTYQPGDRLSVIDPDSIKFTGNPPTTKIPDGAATAHIGKVTNVQH